MKKLLGVKPQEGVPVARRCFWSGVQSRLSCKAAVLSKWARKVKTKGAGGSQDAKSLSCGPFIPLGKAWNYQRAWHRPGNKPPEWGGLVPCFSLPTTVLTESRPRRISQSTDYAREAEAARL